MAVRRRGSILEGQNEANITPLADVTTTLIVVFLITMPAIMLSRVVLPTPERPVNATCSPRATSSSLTRQATVMVIAHRS